MIATAESGVGMTRCSCNADKVFPTPEQDSQHWRVCDKNDNCFFYSTPQKNGSNGIDMDHWHDHSHDSSNHAKDTRGE